METIKELLNKLEQAGKVERFEVYKDIFNHYYNTKDMAIYDSFDNFLNLVDEYLLFDSKPELRIKNKISVNFEIFYAFIRYSHNIDAFEKYFSIFEKYSILITFASAKAKILEYFGYFFWMKQNTERSIEFLEESLNIANARCKPVELPGRYTNLGYIYECAGNMDKAEFYYEEGLHFAKKNNSVNAIKMAYDAMGRLNLSRGNHSKAISYFKESLILHGNDESMDKVSVLNNLASSYMMTKNYEEAKKYFNEIKTDLLKKTDEEMYFSILLNKATNHSKLEEFLIAEKYLIKCLQFAKTNKAVEQMVGCKINLAIIYNKTDRKEQALESYKKAIEITDKTKNEKQQQVLYGNIASLLISLKQFKKALKFVKKGIVLSKKQKNNFSLLRLLRMQTTCLVELNKFKDAFLVQQEFNVVNEDFMKAKYLKEKELESNPLVGLGSNKQYIFRGSNSLISQELTHKVGMPFLGKNLEMVKVINQALLSAGNSNSNILIRGESGTGKEIIAKLIHFSGVRAGKPFIAVNSASFTSGIAQSALFGHLKGAFTGASSNHIGHFETANEGTIFFDEIGDMPLDIQSSLLRILEEKTIKPLGSHINKKVDFRMISATNKNVYDLVKNKEFRLDFLNRINTLEIVIPPLRERKDDLPILIDYFLEDLSVNLKVKRPKMTVSALSFLSDYDYPGNIRELKNLIEKLIVFCKNNEITGEDIRLLLKVGSKETIINDNKSLTFNIAELEKNAVERAMIETNNVQTKAAKLLGITPHSLLRRLKKYGIDYRN